MSSRLPFEIREAMIKVCGKAFWYKDPLKSLLLQAGVPVPPYERYADESKFKIVRHILGELDQRGQSGWRVQHQILQELCRLRGVPDEAADKDEAIAALRWLKELASSQGMVQDEERVARTSRVDEAKRRQAAVTARAAKMEELRKTFLSMITSGSDDPHGRGYGLEDLLAELFDLHEIPYRRPYRTPTEQIDGSFQWKGFDYLVEARWRANPSTEAELGGFKSKVDKKLSSTRGLFLSAVGFRQEVVLEFTRGISSNIVLVDGQDLTLILEGHVSLADALAMKVEKAAQEGVIYFPLSQRFVT